MAQSLATVDADSTSPTTTVAPAAGAPLTHRPGRWIDGWNPEDAQQWASAGRSVARRNLTLSIFAEFLGFAVWALWSIVVPQLPAAGFALTVDQMFWLIAVPSLVGATLRIPYTFAVPIFGGRNWTIISALLLLIPTISLAVVVQDPDSSFTLLLGVAALAGLGGGNFASSMANISFFYPEREKGRALGLNAAGGNIGTAAVQLAVPLVIVGAATVHLERAGWMFVPLAILAAVLAWRFMDNLSHAKSDPRSYGVAARQRHTWIISFVYIGTFGSFIGFSGAFPTLLKGTFPEVTLSIAFLGALVGSVARPLGGTLADRLGGARVTIAAFAVMGAGTVSAIFALRAHSFGAFLASFLVLFVATGVGNGSVYRMIPAVFRHGATDDADRARRARAAAGCLGIAGAVGAFGGFLIPRGFAASTSATGNIQAALWVIVGMYAVMAVVTWAVYSRRGSSFGATVI
ncbi:MULTISPECIES: MFS transporter [Cellulomonas]|uniref:Major facilitator superfamily MFS_1 n=1 Tax=Cellulomonas gilvus (strain ATCC 13127 / NRRL B-14078) TaxID=593907 RepID=F8A0S1_CELGA|nr:MULTISPECIES: nitrate/nitrite transporter [Cellulomonas]AEI11543.1 major facilitator superfamily MFS_1 [Cellulomonas gilvus ATCC 13127]MCR6690596.1 NarK/NasA family nitrate transporter [Cellulomonas sp.]